MSQNTIVYLGILNSIVEFKSSEVAWFSEVMEIL